MAVMAGVLIGSATYGAVQLANAATKPTTYYACFSTKGAPSKAGTTSPTTCTKTSAVTSWNSVRTQGPQGSSGTARSGGNDGVRFGHADRRGWKRGNVHMAPYLVAMLIEHVRLFRPGKDASRWLFTGEGQDPPHQNTVGHRWRTTRTKAGVEGMRVHDLRHFYASGPSMPGAMS